MNWNRTRSWFPVSDEIVYLNHAGVAPISTRVADALDRYSAEATRYGALHYDAFYDREIERVRARAAALIAATPDEIAFVKNTTEGLGIVANGIDWKRGDEILTCDLEYPSNVYPWWNLRDRGVETAMLAGRDGRLPLEVVETALRSPRVRMLAISSVEFGSGAHNDLLALGELCRDRGVLFCVDAIQSLGCFPIDVEAMGIDFLSADGHKWLLSVEGCGIFYCAASVLEMVKPRIVGWRSVTDNQDFDTYHTDLQPSAGRFEEGTPNTPGIFALGAAIDLLLELGVPAIGERVLELTDRLVDGLHERGAELRSPRGPNEGSGIVSFTMPDCAPVDTLRRLDAAGISAAVRRGGVRVSPHFYNTEAEIDRLIGAL
ncbi:MAG: aminotransferase class V-fold PLP-dependent enzyme [Myxococcota bacterium]